MNQNHPDTIPTPSGRHPDSVRMPSRQHPGSCLQVVKFDEIFVKSDSKKLMDRNRPLTWVSVPATFTSRGYHDLLDSHPSEKAMAIYGVFVQLVKLSVQASPYGKLQHSDGSAFSPGYIARTLGIEKTLVETSLETLKNIRWLEPSGHHPEVIPTTSGHHPDTIPPTDRTDRTDRTSPDSESPDWQTAEFIWNQIHALQPKRKRPNMGKWANTVRLMREQDNRSDSDIRSLFTWCNRHSFWQTNILSPSKLREKWDDLELKRGRGAGQTSASTPPTKLEQELEAVMAAQRQGVA